jgi:hypothetical protein
MQCGAMYFSNESKLLDLFLVSYPNDVGDFHQTAVPWSVHERIFFSAVLKDRGFIRYFRDIDRDGVLGAASSLNWSADWFMAGSNEKVEYFTRC